MILRALSCVLLTVGAAAAESLVPEGKLVIAHYMTRMVPGVAGERVWASPELHDPAGSTAAIGGLYLTLPMWSVLKPKLSLEEGVELEIRSARQMGVDGFQFYYPLFEKAAALRSYNRIVAEFIRQSEAKYPGFKVSLCPSLGGNHKQLTETERIEIWGSAMKELLDETHESPAWLRTRDGKLLFYHWLNDSFADGVPHLAQTPEHIERIDAAFERLAKRVGREMEWVFHLRRTVRDDTYLDAVLKHFAAVWGWVESDDDPAFWDHVAERCRKAGTAYTQTVYPDYFTSKVYPRGDKHYDLLNAERALEAGTDGIERHYRQTDLARGQVRLLRAAIRRRAEVVNYATWNDWPEGHHLAPEVHHNFGPSILLRHFAAKWRGQPLPFQNEAILFFKRHPSSAKPTHAVAVKVKSERDHPPAEDEVQLVTILSSPMRAEFNGRDLGELEAGFRIRSLALPKDGPMRLKLFGSRDEEPPIDITTPVGVTRRPHRTNRLSYSYSSRFREEFEALFGEVKPPGPMGSGKGE